MRFSQTITPERITALLAVVAGTLAALLAAFFGAGIGNIIGAAFLIYAATVVVVVIKVPLHLGEVIKASGRGTAATIAITAVVVISIAKAFRGLA